MLYPIQNQLNSIFKNNLKGGELTTLFSPKLLFISEKIAFLTNGDGKVRSTIN